MKRTMTTIGTRTSLSNTATYPVFCAIRYSTYFAMHAGVLPDSHLRVLYSKV